MYKRQAPALPEAYVEVKNVNLLRSGDWAEFPDTVTARGLKHLGVLGDMAELGDGAAQLHGDLADKADAADIDLVITCGALMKNLHDALPTGRLGMHADNHHEALLILRRELHRDDVVMVKGSNASRMGLVVDGLIDMLTETQQQKGVL